jgi:predicted dehydrogenase
MTCVSLIGVSGYARVHYDLAVRLARTGRIRLAAATVINQEEEPARCAELQTLGTVLYRDYREMLSTEKSDLCLIPTGTPLHAEMTCASLESGSAVLVEKPAAATVQDVDRMIRVSEKTGLPVAVGYQAMYDPLTLEIKRRLLEGEIGQLTGIKMSGIWPRLPSYYSRNGWAGRIKMGDAWVLDSPFSNAFSHYLNLMLFWAGSEIPRSATPVEVTAELYRARQIQSADTAAMRVKTLNGPPVHLYVTHSAASIQAPRILISGPDGRIIWEPDGAVVERTAGDPERLPVDAETHRQQMMEAILERLEEKDRFVCDLKLARKPVLCANAAFESAPIATIPEDQVNAKGDDGCPQIRGISEIIPEAFLREALFSEIGVPWARAGTPVSTVSYNRFPQNPLVLAG